MSRFLLPSPKWPPRQLWTEVKTWEQKHLSKALGSSVISKLKAEWATRVRSKAPGSCYNSDPRKDGELKLGQDPGLEQKRGPQGKRETFTVYQPCERKLVEALYLHTSSRFTLPMALGGRYHYCYFTDGGPGRENERLGLQSHSKWRQGAGPTAGHTECTSGPPVPVPLPVQTENSQARRLISSVPGWAQGNANPRCRKTTSNQASKNSRDEVPRKINNKVIVFFFFFFNHNVQRNKALWARASKNSRQESQTHKDFRYGAYQTQGMKYQV